MSSQLPPPLPAPEPAGQGGGPPLPPMAPPPAAAAPPPPIPSSSPPPPSGGSGRRKGLVIGGAIVAALLVGGGIVAVASGDDDEGSSDATSATTAASATTADGDDDVTTTDAETATTVAGGGLDAVRAGTIQIVAQGTFRDPELGFSDGSGAGSGFIISPDGLAVTNNHVVAGAATLEVFIGGDADTSYNASIVGVSECNDLALIDIDAPGELPYLSWYNGPIEPGLDVYAAGYPLGDPEYTLTRGIVAKARAGGDLTGTSSIDHTIEHDANIQPGNSGGPLVTPDGLVVAVNYAGGAVASSTEQFFAIASDLAQPAIERLREGDFESLGINGWAVFDEAAEISGVWVAGVSPGSPASRAEVLPGDIITSMNGLPVGTDGTFKDYCDVIRTSGDRPIAIDVLRYDTQEVLQGELNGDRPLSVAFSFAEEVAEEVSTEDDPATSYSEYETVTDDTGRIVMDVPVEWAERDTTPGTLEDGSPFPYIAASPALESFIQTYETPGVIFALLPASSDVTADLALYAPPEGDCTDLGISDYDDGAFTGKYQVWDACGGTATSLIVLVAQPPDASYTTVVLLQATSDADFDALDHIFSTFNVVG